MEEVRIDANSEICHYCQYKYLYNKVFKARMCNDCGVHYVEYSNFRGIEPTQLPDEED